MEPADVLILRGWMVSRKPNWTEDTEILEMVLWPIIEVLGHQLFTAMGFSGVFSYRWPQRATRAQVVELLAGLRYRGGPFVFFGTWGPHMEV
jgi:hypothetical protein